MLKRRLSLGILLVASLAFVPRMPVHAQDEPRESWHIRHHESLRFAPADSERLVSSRSGASARGPLERLSFEAFGLDFELRLESNDRLVADLDSDQRKAMGPGLRLYRGSVVGEEDSWLRLTQAGGRWSGMIWDGAEIYMIDPADVVAPAADQDEDATENIIYRLSDTEDLVPVRCGLDAETADAEGTDTLSNALGQDLSAAQPLIAMAQSTEAIELVVVADAEFVAENGANTAMAVTSRINVVDGIFDSQVGVALSLVEIVPLASNGSLSSTNAGLLLDQFSDLTASGEIANPGLAHLFTGRNLDGSTAGVAYLRSICRVSSGVGLSETRGGGTRGAITVAHEIGHNFGAPHDNQNGSPCAATPSGFLMNPSLNFGGDSFSECSLDEIEPIVNRAQCLVPVPEPALFSSLLLGFWSLTLLPGRLFGRAPPSISPPLL